MGLVERSADVFSSIAASPVGVSARSMAAIAEDHDLTLEQVIDALAFLEASGMIEVKSIFCVTDHARTKRQQAQEVAA
ncbi:MAG: hypothetical protein AAFP79_05055 [Pseudomonadota bacterium]